MKQEQKQLIINTAIDLFAEHGISRVSVKNIADTINATRGKIYHYFKGGKADITTAILQAFEDCLKSTLPNPVEWKSKDADAQRILSMLFAEFPAADALRLRKIFRIIMAEMYYDKQIARYAKDYLIAGREKLLTDCFQSLSDNGKIAPIDAESAVRFFNCVFVVYSIEEALRYPYSQDISTEQEQNEKSFRDYKNFISFILSKRQVLIS